MNQKLHQIFKNIPEIKPNPGLEMAVFARIEREEAKRMHWKLMFSRFVSIGSALATLAVVAIFGQDFLHSEFISVASLFFSDMQVVAVNWGDYSLSLLETFPTITMIVILLPVFVMLASVNSYLNINNKHKYI